MKPGLGADCGVVSVYVSQQNALCSRFRGGGKDLISASHNRPDSSRRPDIKEITRRGRAHSSMADIEEWLGGKFGRDGAKELRAEMVQNFKIGAVAKVWALDDVPAPEKEGTLDGAELARCVKFVSTILVDCHTLTCGARACGMSGVRSTIAPTVCARLWRASDGCPAHTQACTATIDRLRQRGAATWRQLAGQLRRSLQRAHLKCSRLTFASTTRCGASPATASALSLECWTGATSRSTPHTVLTPAPRV